MHRSKPGKVVSTEEMLPSVCLLSVFVLRLMVKKDGVCCPKSPAREESREAELVSSEPAGVNSAMRQPKFSS